MHLLGLFHFVAAVYGISRISKPGWKAVSFARAIQGRKLNGSVIKETEVDSEGVCRLACVEEERCKSYNFGESKNNGVKFKCQLSDSDRFVDRVKFIEDRDFKYRGIQVHVCSRVVSSW